MRFYQQLKNVYHHLASQLWRAVYGWPDKGMRIFGVTGTNGKTTTSYILTNILSEAYGAEKVGMLTTVSFRIGQRETVNKTKMTTLQSKETYRYLREMKKSGVRYVVLEATSHALDQGRMWGINFDGAIVLNIAREHLDYHRTMEGYTSAKAKIVAYLKRGAPLVGKSDDELVSRIIEKAKKSGATILTFSSEQSRNIVTPLLGDVNKENALAATLLARIVGVSEDAIANGISKLEAVPGRMEWVAIPNEPRFLIDYAVTPDALERLYKSVRQEAKGKVYGVLGACGLRDRGKRPAMAAAVVKYADEIVLTREDPWTEPEEQIFNDLEEGLRRECEAGVSCCMPKQSCAGGGCGAAGGCPYIWRRIVDRREALAYCLEKAGPDDVIVVTGKGAERGMAIGKKIVPWNEREVILELLEERKRSRQG